MDDTRLPFIGRSLLRREDRRLLTGQGQFIADLVLPRMLHAFVVRSQVAHARIRSVDLSRAAAMPGVVFATRRRRSLAAAAAGARRPDRDAEEMDERHPAQIPQSAAAAARTRQSAPCRRGDRDHRRRKPCGGRGRSRAGDLRLSKNCRRWSTPRRRCAATARSSMTASSTNLIGAFSVGRGDFGAVLRRGAASAATAGFITTAMRRSRWSAAASSPPTIRAPNR